MNGSGGRTWPRTLAGYAFAAACLLWVFHDVRIRDIRSAIGGLHWGWIPLAIACDVASYAAQGWRWSLLLRPLGRLSLLRATRAIYAGLFVNELLPMRPGEALRALLVSRQMGTEIQRVLPSMLVERLLDGICLALAFAAVAAYVPLPRNLVKAGDLLGILVLLATGAFVLLILRGPGRNDPAAASDSDSGWGAKARNALRRQALGLREIGLSSRLLAAAGLASALLILQGIAFWLVVRAVQPQVLVLAGLAVFLIVHFGTAIPNAPGNVGSYQFFCVIGLGLFGVDKATAATCSLVVFVILTVPLWALGSLALGRSGFGLRAARSVTSRGG